MALTHAHPDLQLELQAWHRDAQPVGYVASGGTPLVPASSLVIAPWATTAYVEESGQMYFVDQLAASTVTVSETQTTWIILDRDARRVLPGWTRTGLTHYLQLNSGAQPIIPDGALLLARVDKAASVIDSIEYLFDGAPQMASLSGIVSLEDPRFGINFDETDESAKFQSAVDFCIQASKRILYCPPHRSIGMAAPLDLGNAHGLQVTTMVATAPRNALHANAFQLIAISGTTSLIEALGAPQQLGINGLLFDGRNVASLMAGVTFRSTIGLNLSNNLFINFPAAAPAIRGVDNLYTTIRGNLVASSCSGNSLDVDADAAQGIGVGEVSGNQWFAEGGVRLQALQCLYSANTHEGSPGQNIALDVSGSNQLHVDTNYFELQEPTSGVQIGIFASATNGGVSVTNNYISGTNKARVGDIGLDMVSTTTATVTGNELRNWETGGKLSISTSASNNGSEVLVGGNRFFEVTEHWLDTGGSLDMDFQEVSADFPPQGYYYHKRLGHLFMGRAPKFAQINMTDTAGAAQTIDMRLARYIRVSNSAPTIITTISGIDAGGEFMLFTDNANTTMDNSVFNLLAGVNTLMVAFTPYHFCVVDGTVREVGATA